MINFEIKKLEDGRCYGFCCKGHSGYANKGSDIVCAAVSALTVNTVNSIEKFTEDKFSINQEDGLLDFTLESEVFSDDTGLLLDSLVLGIKEIAKDNPKYVCVI